MTTNHALLLVVGMCVIVLGIGRIKNKAEVIVNIVLRVVAGAVCIHFANAFFASRGIAVSVGINPATMAAIGALGLPGFVLLYGIVFYKVL